MNPSQGAPIPPYTPLGPQGVGIAPSNSPALAAVIKEIEDREADQAAVRDPWSEFPLSPGEYEALRQHFQGNRFWVEKLRYVRAKK